MSQARSEESHDYVLSEQCSTCGGPARPVDLTLVVNEPFHDGTRVGPRYEIDYACERRGCSLTFQGFVIMDDFHRARIASGASAETEEGRERIAVAMAVDSAHQTARAVADHAASLVHIGGHIVFEQAFCEAFDDAYAAALADAHSRVAAAARLA